MTDATRERRDLLSTLCQELDASPDQELDTTTLRTIAKDLRVPRRSVHLVEIDSASLQHLATPALVILSGRLGIVRSVGGAEIVVEHGPTAHCRVTRDALVELSGGVVLELLPSLVRKGRFTARMLDFLGARWGDLSKVAASALALAALGLVTPFVTGMVVDRALPERTPKLLSVIAFTVLFVAAQRALFTWLERRVMLTLHARLESAVGTSLFDHLLRIPYAALARGTVGGWVETLMGARRVQRVMTETILLPSLHSLTAVTQGFAMLRLHPAIGAVVVAGAGVLLLLSLGFALRASKLERRVIDSSAQQYSTLFEVLDGLPTLRTSGAEQRGVLRWLDRLLTARVAQVRTDVLGVRAGVVLGGTRDVIAFGAFLWAADVCLAGTLSVGEALSLSMLAEQFLAVICALAGVLSPALSARPHVERIDALLAHEDVVSGSETLPAGAAERADAVVLDDVWFRYGPDQPWILEGYSLRVRTLEQLELRGGSGTGKSTILRLIAGLYLPERGSVRVFGRAPGRLCDQICYLPQDAQLLSGSILQNLRLLSGASIAELMEAAQQSGLSELVAGFPMGYETVLPAGAATLSGGQRQLIVWTAAMASRRRLLLLDEALSHVDPLLRMRLLASARDGARSASLARPRGRFEGARTIVSVEHERTRAQPRAATDDGPLSVVGAADLVGLRCAR